MAAVAGPMPFSNEYDAFRSKYKRTNAVTKRFEDVDWSLSSGWRVNKETDWANKPKRSKMKQVRLYTGKMVNVPDADYEDFIGFHKSAPSDADTDVGAYIDGAKWTQTIDAPPGCHIVKIEYAPTRQLLDVLFYDGAEVVFFRVPKEVYSELYYLAESGSTIIDKKGVVRHLLGIRFWDIVRIRGIRDSSRYRYEYLSEGKRKGSSFEQEMNAETEAEVAARGGGVKAVKSVADDIKATYDLYAKNMLSPSLQQEYAKQTDNKARAAFLRKYNIL